MHNTPENDYRYDAFCPKTGVKLREATQEEVDAYFEQPARVPSFRKMILVGDVLVDEIYTGSGPVAWE